MCRLSHPVTLTFHHHPPDFFTAIEQYSDDQYSGGLQVVSDNIGCTVKELLNLQYHLLPVNDINQPQEVPPELVDTIQRWMGKASKATVELAACKPHWYQQRLQLQPVDARWWHTIVHQQQQLIEILQQGISSGTIPCREIQKILPFDVPHTSVTFTTPSSIPIVHVPEPVLLQHHQQLIKIVDIVNDSRATTLLLSGILDSGQVLADSSGKSYPVIPIFEGGRMIRIQGDSPIVINRSDHGVSDSGLDSETSLGEAGLHFPLILDSYTTDLSTYSTEQLNSLLRYINGLQDIDGSGDQKYVLLQNRIVHTLARRRHTGYPNHVQGASSSLSS
jgi:hypothetical protein